MALDGAPVAPQWGESWGKTRVSWTRLFLGLLLVPQKPDGRNQDPPPPRLGQSVAGVSLPSTE